MLPYTPGEPTSGDPILPWAQEITMAVRALTPTSSPDIRAHVTASGTSYHLARNLRGSTSRPVTDTDGYATIKDPDGRQTVQHNPEDYSGDPDSHYNELQLHNVHLTKEGSNSIPFFMSETNKQGAETDKIVGELYWATADADRKDDETEKKYKSLTMADTHSTSDKGKYSMSLYGFTGCDISTVGYAKESTEGLGGGRELEWRLPCTLNDSACNDTPGTADIVTAFDAGVAQGSYITLTFTARTLTVDRAALDISDGGETQTAYVPVTIDPNDIPPTASGDIIHNQLDGTNSPDFPEWGANNNGHDRRYLRINASWTGDSYNNTTNGIAHDTSGTNAVDFLNGNIYGPPGEVTIAYSDRKLWTHEGEQVVTLDWNTRTLTAASASAPWKATRAFRVTADGDDAKYVDFLVTDGQLEIKDQDGATLARFKKVTE